MKRTLTIVCGLALATLAINSWAQEEPIPGGPGRGPHGPPPGFPPPIMVLLDADDDGVLSSTEIENASAQLLTLDTDKDGQLTIKEACPLPPKGTNAPAKGPRQGPGKGPGKKGKGPGAGMGPGGHPPMFMVLFDVDRDGIISSEEIETAPEVLAALDKDEDGQLTPEELRPRHGRGPGGPGGPGAGTQEQTQE